MGAYTKSIVLNLWILCRILDHSVKQTGYELSTVIKQCPFFQQKLQVFGNNISLFRLFKFSISIRWPISWNLTLAKSLVAKAPRLNVRKTSFTCHIKICYGKFYSTFKKVYYPKNSNGNFYLLLFTSIWRQKLRQFCEKVYEAKRDRFNLLTIKNCQLTIFFITHLSITYFYLLHF